MFDLSEPVGWPVIVGTIVAIFAVTALGIAAVKMSGCDKKKKAN